MPFYCIKLNYKQIVKVHDCLIDKLFIRKSAKKIGINARSTFTLRFKLITYLKKSEKDNNRL